MSGDLALEHTPTNGVKRRRPSAGDDDVPAAKRPSTDVQNADPLTLRLHKEQSVFRTIYLHYGTLIKDDGTGAEAAAFQGLLDCANGGSLGARRLAARFVAKFIARFPCHLRQAFRLLADLYGDERQQDSHHRSGCLPNGTTTGTTDADAAFSSRAPTPPSPAAGDGGMAPTHALDATLPAATTAKMGAAMRRDALLGMGNVIEAALRAPGREGAITVLEVVRFLVRHLHRLQCAAAGGIGSVGCCGVGLASAGRTIKSPELDGHVSASGTVAAAVAAAASGFKADGGGGAVTVKAELETIKAEPCDYHRSLSVEPKAEANGNHIHSLSNQMDLDLQHPSCGAGGKDGGGDAECDFELEPDVVVVQNLLLRAFHLFPRAVLVTCLQPLMDVASTSAAPAAGGEPKQEQRQGQPQQGGTVAVLRDGDGSYLMEACELVLGLLVQRRQAATAATAAASTSTGGGQDAGTGAGRGGGEGDEGGVAAGGKRTRVPSEDGGGVVQGDGATRDGDADVGVGAAASTSSAAVAAAPAASARDEADGGTADRRPAEAPAPANGPVQAAGAGAGPHVDDSFSGSGVGRHAAGCVAEEVLSCVPDTQAWVQRLVAQVTRGKAAQSLPSTLRAHLDQLLQLCAAAPQAVPDTAAHPASPKASPDSAGTDPHAAAAAATASGGAVGAPAGPSSAQAARQAAATAAPSVLGSDDGSRSVPMDIDQSISTVFRADGGAGGPSGAAGGAAGSAAGPADTAATPAPPPPPPPPPPVPPPSQHAASYQPPGGGAAVPLPPPPPLPPSYSVAADGGPSTGLRGGHVCRAEACLYIGGLPPGLTEAVLVSELGRAGVVESVHPYDQHQQPQPPPPHGGPAASVLGEEVYVVFGTLRDAAVCYEGIARGCPFGGSRLLQVEFCVAFPADSPAARRRLSGGAAAAAAAGSQYVWILGSLAAASAPAVGGAVSPTSIVSALQTASLPVPQQILQVQGRAPGLLLQMGSSAVVPRATAFLQAAFVPPLPLPPPPPPPPLPLPVVAAAAAAAAPSPYGSAALPAAGPAGQHSQGPQSGGGSGGGGGAPAEPPPPPNGRTIWIGQLHESVREDELLSICRQHGGEVMGHRIMRGSHCAFVDFATQAGADAAKRALHGARLGSQHLRVEWKLESGPAHRPPRSLSHHGPHSQGSGSGGGGGSYGMGHAGAAALAGPPAGPHGMPPTPGGAGSGAPAAGAAVASTPSGAHGGTQPLQQQQQGGLGAVQGQPSPNPQAVAAASVAAAAAAVAARGTAYPGGPRVGADRWAPVAMPSAPAPAPAQAPSAPPPTGGVGPSQPSPQHQAQPPQRPPAGVTAPGMNPAVAAAVRQASLMQHPVGSAASQAPLPPPPQHPPATAYPAPHHHQHHHPQHLQAHPSPLAAAAAGGTPTGHVPAALHAHVAMHGGQPLQTPATYPGPPLQQPPHPHAAGYMPGRSNSPPAVPQHTQYGPGMGAQGPSPPHGSGHPPQQPYLQGPPQLPQLPQPPHLQRQPPPAHGEWPSLSAAQPMPASGGVVPYGGTLAPPLVRYGSAPAGALPPPPPLPHSPALPPDAHGMGSGGGAAAAPQPCMPSQPHALAQQHAHIHLRQSQPSPQPPQQQSQGQQAQPRPQQHPQQPAVTWQGSLAKSGSYMCTLQCTGGGASAASGATAGEREPVTWPATLDVKLRVDLTFVVHTLYYHTAPHARAMRRLVTPGGPEQRNKLTEFLSYLAEKNRAGVIKLDAAAGLPPRTLYLVPPSEQVCASLGTEWSPLEPFLLALVVPTTGGAAGGK